MMELPETDVIARAHSARPRGFIDWSPKNEAGQELLRNVQYVISEYRDFLPLTARQIFYRLVGTKGYGKTERDYKRLTELLNKARRAQIISFDSIRDDGTMRDRAPGTVSEAMVARHIEYIVDAGINRQVEQPILQIVMCEAGGMVPQLARVSEGYGVDVISAGGFNSLTDKRALAREIADDGRDTLVWHVGDYDPSGVHVFQSLAEDVTQFAFALGSADVAFKRLAITEPQIEDHNLPYAPAKRSDNRAFDGRGTVQAEALPPEVLAETLENALALFFDPEADERTDERNGRLKEQFADVLAKLN